MQGLNHGAHGVHGAIEKKLSPCTPWWMLFLAAILLSACARPPNVAALDQSLLKSSWEEKVKTVFEEATLPVPEKIFMQSGGKNGLHTEQLGYILTELQYMQRAYPNSEW